MLSPLYGQDSGAIWNRTWNDYVTEPEGCGYERCPQEPGVYSKRIGDEHEDKSSDSYVTLPIYVDNGRIYYDPTAKATGEAARDRESGSTSGSGSSSRRLTQKTIASWARTDVLVTTAHHAS